MKTKFFKLALSVLFGLFMTMTFVSCEKDEIDLPDFTSSLIGKWNVSNDNAEYSSFEFTKDKKYIIQQKVSSLRSAPANNALRSLTDNPETVYIIIIFGDYSTLSEDGGVYNLNLGDFGLIKITISESGASVEVNGEVFDITKDENTVTGNKDKTELLCHPWRVNNSDDNENYDGTITFTPNGTYFVADSNDEDDNLCGKWKWTSSNTIEAEFKSYNDYGGGEIIEEIVIQHSKIIKLTTTELIVSYIGENGDNLHSEFRSKKWHVIGENLS
ncbi:MAG: hypothetical protein LBS54_09355 [Dysgonamonadaceae bacterium]|jgi:hypothetical protein|nr:hypothetical protein [Dysgonamonadaceae bacterium]